MRIDLLEELWHDVTAVVTTLDDPSWARATRAAGWSVRDLVTHQLLDAQRALVALVSPAEAGAEADVDEVTYWVPFRPCEGDGGRAHAEFVRISASAYAAPAALVEHWSTTAAAALRAARAHDRDSSVLVETQGHVITVADLVSTLVVESTVHLLDLTLEVPGGPPAKEALAHTLGVLEGLHGGPMPGRWGPVEAVLRGTGRLPVDDPAFPLLG